MSGEFDAYMGRIDALLTDLNAQLTGLDGRLDRIERVSVRWLAIVGDKPVPQFRLGFCTASRHPSLRGASQAAGCGALGENERPTRCRSETRPGACYTCRLSTRPLRGAWVCWPSRATT
jgi:hypothetical protein